MLKARWVINFLGNQEPRGFAAYQSTSEDNGDNGF